MPVATTALSVPDLGHIGRLLSRIADHLDRGPVHELVSECEEALGTCLAHERPAAEPGRPGHSELVSLIAMLSSAAPHDRVSFMRQIRRLLGRLDARS